MVAGCDWTAANRNARTSGIVFDLSANEPAEGVSVVMKVGRGNGGFSGSYHVVASTRTDHEGRYSLSYDEGERVHVYVNDEPYDHRYSLPGSYGVFPGKERFEYIELYQNVGLTVHAEIFPLLGPEDTYWLSAGRVGVKNGSVRTPYARGNQFNTVKLVVLRSGVRSERIDSVYCTLGEVSEYTISY